MSRRSRRDWIKLAGASLASYALAPAVLRSPLLASPREGELFASVDGMMVVIPAGSFLMGTTPQEAQVLAAAYGYDASWLDGETPQSVVYLPAYAIDRFPVTNRQYARFCASTGHPPPTVWFTGKHPNLFPEHPVTNVNRADARAYAAWVGKRLPREAEWEKAARGVDGRRFPWGDQFDVTACQWNADPTAPSLGTAPITTHPNGASPYGVQDMAGNVAEWCADGPSPWTAYIKGGAWITSRIIHLRPAARNLSGGVNQPAPFYGFRCVKDLHP